MHTLGMGTTGLVSYYGPVRNPWNADNIPGGSSAGSAAAVAGGLCYATLDTDAVGSTRLPAACCGVVGFKGTFGLIRTDGILAGTPDPGEMIRRLNHAALTTRSAGDTALVLDALAERNEHAPGGHWRELTRDEKLRVGVGNNLKAAPELTAALARAAEVIGRLGHTLGEAAIPFVDLSRGFDHIEADRQAIAAQAFTDFDVLLLPTTATTVPTVQQAGDDPTALSPEHTLFANYYGLPAISMPCGFDPAGLPLGVQIVGRPWGDAGVLRLAASYQAAANFVQRPM
jgi:aspartyl-tRNA(Asn)/glutamyl-tRNA(Gln) amidotransferase subunit A